MKFEMYECPACGYQCVSPADNPVCRDCGAPMVVIVDEATRRRLDAGVKKDLDRLLGGEA